ncbi:Zinc/iron permease [Sporormia fimetaria CBS 119925]|uniref:Zinc/iron permease n=1 Tax=Sporormia fimetaria CBS 119925 TaxID=1340428 RepID=A0A6A6UYP2_9PLEO|nr:Zinc/iron permease [Sporormia fimetaria CBS 119925]
MALDNDTRGWIMAVISGIACTFGASFICVDVVIRLLPGRKNFQIDTSDYFLSLGLSLSFGVMVFSSLYSILPSSKRYLERGGLTPRDASLTLTGCFLFGALFIYFLSKILHSYIPHHVVDCDHEHGDEETGKGEDVHDTTLPSHEDSSTPVESRDNPTLESQSAANGHSHGPLRRPSLHTHLTSKMSQLMGGSKRFCDDNGQCYGYSEACGLDCFRHKMQARHARSQTLPAKNMLRPSGLKKTATTNERQPLLQDVNDTAVLTPTASTPGTAPTSLANSIIEPPTDSHPTPDPSTAPPHQHQHTHSHLHSHTHTHSHPHSLSHNHAQQHHHHVPTNAFLSLGLQTSLAIALHKIPEGFITYATNHANPTLGTSIFLALFIHNITEGFALALPLYLALTSRWKAVFWSALLGGVSQPLGAGVAALWFGVSKGEREPGEKVYGCMFAATAGVMTCVALQLWSQGLGVKGMRGACFVGAFVGMGVLGVSSALTA